MRGGTAIALVAVGLVAANGCGNGTNKYSFSDQLGRHCVFTCTGNHCSSVACDATPMPTGGCSGNPSAACFGVAFDNLPPPAPSTPVLELCAACCVDLDSGPQWSSWPQDCSAVVCTQDADCAGSGAHCVAGYCQK
ncbi:MAG TPA: hypothetical protein VLM85_13080 [Polyangiaceae bacterium]|nr:hypothetical protein [Polyangiaceae bacterium]